MKAIVVLIVAQHCKHMLIVLALLVSNPTNVVRHPKSTENGFFSKLSTLLLASNRSNRDPRAFSTLHLSKRKFRNRPNPQWEPACCAARPWFGNSRDRYQSNGISSSSRRNIASYRAEVVSWLSPKKTNHRKAE